MRTTPILRTAALAAVAALLLAGCTTRVYVSADEVAAQAADALAPQLGFTPDIACPDDLDAEVGATMTCTLADETGAEYDTVVTVTGVDGADVSFDIDVITG